MSKLNFQNFYAFEFTLGFVGVAAGFQLFHYGLISIIGVFVGSCLIFDSTTRWNKSQRNKEDLESLELQRASAVLDFDIDDVKAETDFDWVPDDFVNGEPVGCRSEDFSTYTIDLLVYNPCVIENVVRGISIEVSNRKKKARTKSVSYNPEVNKFPVSVPPRKHLKMVLHALVNNMKGKQGDELTITITSMDGKKTEKKFKIDSYQYGRNIKESIPE